MSIRAHPEWAVIRQYIRLEAYDRDTSQTGHVRKRIEVNEPDEPHVRAWLLAVEMPCVRCGVTIHPVRARKGWVTWYYRASCGKFPCRNSKATAQEYLDIEKDLLDAPPDPVTPMLF